MQKVREAERDRQYQEYKDRIGDIVNGVVKRHGGPSTAWVNGRAVVEGQPVPPATRLGVTARGVTLDGTAVRVGESLDLSTRERSDIVAPGAVTSRGKK